MKTKFLNEASLIFNCICVLLHRRILLSLVRCKNCHSWRRGKSWRRHLIFVRAKVLHLLFSKPEAQPALCFSQINGSHSFVEFYGGLVPVLRRSSTYKKWYFIFTHKWCRLSLWSVNLLALTKQDQLHLEQPWSIAACTHALQRAFPAPLPRQSGDT